MNIFTSVGLVFILSASLAGCPKPGLQMNPSMVASDDVSDSMSRRARDLVEKETVLKRSFQNDRVVYIATEPVREKNAEGEDDTRENYRVIHYRYGDDAAIHSIVNLKQAKMLTQQILPHLPTPLSQGELEKARLLALKDRRVREELGQSADRVHVEALVIRTTSEKDPWFGHRVVQLLFRVGRDYRHSPEVVVDLTENKVMVETKEALK